MLRRQNGKALAEDEDQPRCQQWVKMRCAWAWIRPFRAKDLKSLRWMTHETGLPIEGWHSCDTSSPTTNGASFVRCAQASRGGATGGRSGCSRWHFLPYRAQPSIGDGLPMRLGATPGETQDNRLCSALLTGLGPRAKVLADRGYNAERIRVLVNEREWTNATFYKRPSVRHLR